MLKELSSASLRSGIDGMVEYWNNGFWKIGSVEDWKFLKLEVPIHNKKGKKRKNGAKIPV
jgi:hypothetical protein